MCQSVELGASIGTILEAEIRKMIFSLKELAVSIIIEKVLRAKYTKVYESIPYTHFCP